MAGRQGRLRDSLQFRLSATLSVAILVVAAAAGAFSFATAFDEAIELQDDVLRQVAALVDQQGLPAAGERLGPRPGVGDEESRVIVHRLQPGAPDGRGVDAGGLLRLPPDIADGLHTLTVDGERFRVLARTGTGGERYVVAQEAAFRDRIARDGAWRTVMPFLLLVPILALVAIDLVRKMFGPMTALARDIEDREALDLRPIDVAHLPVEARPFAGAINRQLLRVKASMDGQRRFVADAAHELRSPLTALSLQAERLAGAGLDDRAAARMADLRQGISRARSLLDQMLSLARAQAGEAIEARPAGCRLDEVVRQVVQDLMPLADARGIDVGVSALDDAPVPVSALDATLVARNLIDNAIRYTPSGAGVDIAVVSSGSGGSGTGGVLLQVRDAGPGLEAAELERVFDPFYRAPGSGQLGSGLGLTIVRTVCERSGIRITLTRSDAAQHPGLLAEARFPSPSTAAPADTR